VVLTGASGEQFVPGFEDLLVGDTGHFALSGIESSTQYYFRVRVRVENEDLISVPSATASAITRASGTPFTNWAVDNSIDPPTDTSDFDGDSISDLQEYLFATDPAQPGSPSEALTFEISPTGLQVRVRQSIAPGATFEYLGGTDLIFEETALLEGTSLEQYNILSTQNFGSFEELIIEVNTGSLPRYFVRVRATLP